MKRQSHYRRARQNRLTDQPLVHTLTQELAVLANDFITEHAGSVEGPRLSRIHRLSPAEERTAGGVHGDRASCRLVAVGLRGVGRGSARSTSSSASCSANGS